MPTPWHGRLAFDLELLPWISPARLEPFSWCCWWSMLLGKCCRCQDIDFEDGLQPRMEWWLQPRKWGMHSVKEIDMLAAKMDLLAKRLDHYEKVSAQETLKAMESHMTCEVWGDVGHSGNSCSETQEDLNFVNTDNRLSTITSRMESALKQSRR